MDMIISACILYHFIMVFYQRSGPGPLGPVQRILVVRSGPEGPQFTRSVGTLVDTEEQTKIMFHPDDMSQIAVSAEQSDPLFAGLNGHQEGGEMSLGGRGNRTRHCRVHA